MKTLKRTKASQYEAILSRSGEQLSEFKATGFVFSTELMQHNFHFILLSLPGIEYRIYDGMGDRAIVIACEKSMEAICRQAKISGGIPFTPNLNTVNEIY